MNIEFSASGVAGDITTILVPVKRHFRTERVEATDTFSCPGLGTVVSNISVNGQNRDLPKVDGMRYGSRPHFINGSRDDDSIPGYSTKQFRLLILDEHIDDISIEVQFLVDCDFKMTLFGKESV